MIRSLAFLLVIQKAFGTDSKYALLMVVGLISFIAASVIFADLMHRLVRGEVVAVGFPKSVNSDVSREKMIDASFKFDKIWNPYPNILNHFCCLAFNFL